MKAISESGLLARFPFTLLGGDVLRRSCPDMGVRSPWGLLGRFPLTLLGGDVLRRSCPDIGVRSPVKPSRNLEALSKLSVADLDKEHPEAEEVTKASETIWSAEF